MDHTYQNRVREASQLASEAIAVIESVGDPTLTDPPVVNASDVNSSTYRTLMGMPGGEKSVGVEIVKDKTTKEHAHTERDRIVEMAFERGVLFLGCGPTAVRLCPPLVVTKEEADVAVDVLEECITAVGKGV